MADTDQILQAIEGMRDDIQSLKSGQQTLEIGQKELQQTVQGQGVQLTNLQKTVDNQGVQLASLQTDVKGMKGQLDTFELKVEAYHTANEKDHHEILNALVDAGEIDGHEQKKLEERVERIEKHVNLPPK